jgi:dynein heavy chain
MSALEEIRKKESEIDIDFRPVVEMFALLENSSYMAEKQGGKSEDIEASSILDKDWAGLVKQASAVQDTLFSQQANFKKDLIEKVNFLVGDVTDFRADFEADGPGQPGIEPKDALEKLSRFKDEYQIRERKFTSYNGGETLFGLPNKPYPELEKTKKEIELFDKLYSLYTKVKSTLGQWRDILWTDIEEEIIKMTEQIDNYQRDCSKLPGPLK